MTWTIDTTIGTVKADFLEGQVFDTQPNIEIEPTFVFKESAEGDARTRHSALQALVDAAQEQTIRVGEAGGKPYYRERLEAFDDVDSLLIGLTPEGDNRGAVWAVLVDATDETPSIERDVYVWTLECVVLRRQSPGDKRKDVIDEFSEEVV